MAAHRHNNRPLLISRCVAEGVDIGADIAEDGLSRHGTDARHIRQIDSEDR
jgi:hypothetical protein